MFITISLVLITILPKTALGKMYHTSALINAKYRLTNRPRNNTESKMKKFYCDTIFLCKVIKTKKSNIACRTLNTKTP